MDALQKKQHDLETELERVVYPILTLPPEIVSRFFVAELWNCVRLGIYPGSRKASRELDVLDTWFARAEKRPLSVILFGLPQPMISRLVAVGDQLQSLSVPISLEDFRGLARDGIEFPNLLRLELEIVRVIETPFQRALRMPRLQSLTLHKIDIAPFTLPSLRRLELDLDPRTQSGRSPPSSRAPAASSNTSPSHSPVTRPQKTSSLACAPSRPSPRWAFGRFRWASSTRR
ncbi:hypothetical protein C8R47DRAFT_1229298 [Mycena vitilis]|nr:hypothetical protein C8R47DRAFT_1229298 [Mycena vitilis]